jgi:hypothetical protein
MSTPLRVVKVKVYGDHEADVLRVANDIRGLYAPNARESDLRRSEPSGYHCFVTVYLKEEGVA